MRSERTNEKLETPKSGGIHRNITEFYRSMKVLLENQPIEDSAKDIDRAASHQKRRGKSEHLTISPIPVSEGSNILVVDSDPISLAVVSKMLCLCGYTDQKYEEEENDDSTALSKRLKLIWTDERHNKFLQATNLQGVDGAYPKDIPQLMNVRGLTKENVSSHLQEKTIMARPAELGLAPYNIPPSPPLNLQEGHLFSNLKTTLETGISVRRELLGFGENIHFVKEYFFEEENIEERGISGAVRDGIGDELFNTENSSTQMVFRDEDLDDFF
ncbi:hypothetical protein L484_004649 [Morus notabilis]|uniref:Uncharacterized protein n=1 Tax=Morus notabilis TaxID=981085 RepID=W9RHQ0_9ROSA|nr:hypothetical protein L484_004649 [Morus notabilis]